MKNLRALLLTCLVVLSSPAVFSSSARAAKPLQQMYGNLLANTRGNEAVQARVSGNTLTIDLYVNFRGSYNTRLGGATHAELARRGFRLWGGTYKGSRYDFEPGMAFTVKVNVNAIYNGKGRKPGQNYIDFVCLTGKGRSYVFQGIGYYNRELMGTYEGAIPNKSYPCGSIIMYNGLNNNKPYTPNQYIKVSAHELGHVLGLGDLYKKDVASTPECPGGKKYVEGDIMGAHGRVTPNNIEMFLEAYRTNRYQAYVNSHLPEVKSRVIRSY